MDVEVLASVELLEVSSML